METTRRTMAKALSWQASGLVVMTAVTYAVTGSVAEGGLVALAGSAAGMVSYVIHERVWARIAWGRQADRVARLEVGECGRPHHTGT